jgi:hypothetical protein
LQATISNDGAKILQLLDIVHPAAKTLVDISRAQDAEIGDGTTTVTLLAAELLKQAKMFVEDGVHPQIIIRVRCCGPLPAWRRYSAEPGSCPELLLAARRTARRLSRCGLPVATTLWRRKI